MPNFVHFEVNRGVARLTLDSPHNRNALSAQLQRELRVHLREALNNDAVRVLVLTGAGASFCSGADLNEQRKGKAAEPELMVDILQTLWYSPKPVVARVNGHARAGGVGLVGACDIAIAAKQVTFGFPEVRLGLLPAIIAVTCLPRITVRSALELVLTGEIFAAQQAADIGLINRAVDSERLDEEVDRHVDMLSSGAPEAISMIKPMIEIVRKCPMNEAFAKMAELSAARFSSDEAREGMRAFTEKRRPDWSNMSPQARPENPRTDRQHR